VKHIISASQFLQSAFTFLAGIVVVNAYGNHPSLNDYYVIFSLFTFVASIFTAPLLQSYVAYQRDFMQYPDLIHDTRVLIVRRCTLLIGVWLACMLFMGSRLALSSEEFTGWSYVIVIASFAFLLFLTLLTAIDSAELTSKGKVLQPIFFSYSVPMGISLLIFYFEGIGVNAILIGLSFGSIVAYLLGRVYNKKYRIHAPVKSQLNQKPIFREYFLKGSVGILPLISIGPMLIFFVAQDASLSVVFFTIPISFAGVISILTSHGSFIMRISSTNNISIEKNIQSILLTMVLAVITCLITIVIFRLLGDSIYKVDFSNEAFEMFNAILISGVFISGYNVIRADDWKANLSAIALFQPLVLIISTGILFYFLQLYFEPIFIASGYSFSFLVLLIGRIITLYSLSKSSVRLIAFAVLTYAVLNYFFVY